MYCSDADIVDYNSDIVWILHAMTRTRAWCQGAASASEGLAALLETDNTECDSEKIILGQLGELVGRF